MTILWLILKIILWLLGIVVSLLLCLLLGLLFLPVEYRIRAEKYETIAYRIQLKIFYLISILYDSKTNNSIKIQLCGRTIKEVPFSEAEEVVEEKMHKAEKATQKATKEEVKDITRTKEVQTKQTAPDAQKTGKPTKTEKPKQSKSSTPAHINWVETIKVVWQDENRIPFIRFCKALLKDIWRALLPKVCTFNVIFGLEDPAETGTLLAKLMALYPFYAPYGNIMGDFEKPTLEGDIKLYGQMNLYRFVKPLVVFVTHKEVRNYIKRLMKIGKDE